jgi:enoyl-CoA hydratase/carnithine racemase
MNFANISITQEGPAAVVTLDRPQRRNALSLGLMLELIGCLDEIGRNREIRAVILAAAGKVFCSGHDLSEMTGRDIDEYRRIFDVSTDLMMKKPFRSRSSPKCKALPPPPDASWWPPATWRWLPRKRPSAVPV